MSDLDKWKEVVHYKDVDYLEAELLPLPIETTTYDFMIRFTAPIATVLSRDPIRISHMATLMGDLNVEDLIKEAVQKRWEDMITTAFDTQDPKPEEEEFRKKLMDRKEIVIHKMELTRVEDDSDK